MMTNTMLEGEVERLTHENESLRRAIEIQKRQMIKFNTKEEVRRLRAKLPSGRAPAST